MIDSPILRFAGRHHETKRHHYPSLMLELVVMLDNEELHLPVRSPYKHFTSRWAWNVWLSLPIKFCDLPREAMLCINIYDCNGPNEMYPIGGTLSAISWLASVLS